MYALIECVTDYDKHGQRSTDITLWGNDDKATRLTFAGRWMPEAEAAQRWPAHKIMSVTFARIGEAPEPA
jgi:hypothetical protein